MFLANNHGLLAIFRLDLSAEAKNSKIWASVVPIGQSLYGKNSSAMETIKMISFNGARFKGNQFYAK